ncbi:hypothetical protein ANO14919_023810 [Xylariales sp. No.14919]|nr:hypothetical protein ANO14919_023810 [Xylariales sp. No.14919]
MVPDVVLPAEIYDPSLTGIPTSPTCLLDVTTTNHLVRLDLSEEPAMVAVHPEALASGYA